MLGVKSTVVERSSGGSGPERPERRLGTPGPARPGSSAAQRRPAGRMRRARRPRRACGGGPGSSRSPGPASRPRRSRSTSGGRPAPESGGRRSVSARVAVAHSRAPSRARTATTVPCWSTVTMRSPSTSGTRSGWDGASRRLDQRSWPSASANARTSLPLIVAGGHHDGVARERRRARASARSAAPTGARRSRRRRPAAPRPRRPPSTRRWRRARTRARPSSDATTWPGNRTDQRACPLRSSIPTRPPAVGRADRELAARQAADERDRAGRLRRSHGPPHHPGGAVEAT